MEILWGHWNSDMPVFFLACSLPSHSPPPPKFKTSHGTKSSENLSLEIVSCYAAQGY